MFLSVYLSFFTFAFSIALKLDFGIIACSIIQMAFASESFSRCGTHRYVDVRAGLVTIHV
jgi:hypothetical protein